jgi:hypothetical protein
MNPSTQQVIEFLSHHRTSLWHRRRCVLLSDLKHFRPYRRSFGRASHCAGSESTRHLKAHLTEADWPFIAQEFRLGLRWPPISSMPMPALPPKAESIALSYIATRRISQRAKNYRCIGYTYLYPSAHYDFLATHPPFFWAQSRPSPPRHLSLQTRQLLAM